MDQNGTVSEAPERHEAAMEDDTTNPTLTGREAVEDLGEDLEALARAAASVRSVIVGQDRVQERLWACLLGGGHALLEGVPGVGKTALLSALSHSVGGSFSRIQFTADLMPSDIVGTRIYKAALDEFSIETGPIFANFVLADEVNRAPAKVQSALLEVMAEAQVTLGGTTMPVPSPFLVLATQNPIDSEGTYALPEAQRDRFMMRIMVDYPTIEEEWEVMYRHAVRPPAVEQAMSIDTLSRLQRQARTWPMDEAVARYALDLVMATRDPAAYGMPELVGEIEYGASPRASLALLRAARGLALYHGEAATVPQDVYDVAFDVLNHRLVLSYQALAADITTEEVLYRILSTVRAPAAASGRRGPGATTDAGTAPWLPPMLLDPFATPPLPEVS